MRIGNVSLTFLLAAMCCVGCSSQKEIHLIDGRSFTVKRSHNDGQFLSFVSDGWEYILPVILVAKEKPKEPAFVRRINVTTNRITTSRTVFYGFDDLFLYLDTQATKANPVILVLKDVVHWSAEKQKNFGGLYGTKKRTYVGMESYWVKD